MTDVSGRLAPAPAKLFIRPSRGFRDLRLMELWEYRELLYFLTWSQVKVRYKQAVLGAAWAVLQPLLTAIIFTVVFGYLGGVASDGVPYPLFSFAGLLPWTFFAQGVAQSAESLVAHQNLVQKVFFPRLILPLSAILAKSLDLAWGLLFLLLLMPVYGVTPSVEILFLPGMFLYVMLASATAGIWLSVLNVAYRDVHHLVPFIVQVGLFVTPVIYPANRIVDKLAEAGLPAWLYGLNPMVGAVEGFRWALLGASSPRVFVISGLLVTLPLLLAGIAYFRRLEKTFADIV